MAEQLAIDGGTPVRTAPFPAWPVFDEREEKALLQVLHSGRWGLGGTQVEAFAQGFAAFQNAKYGICVPNGTTALELALRTLQLQPGDEVITTPFTFIATVSPLLWMGIKPVFVDADWDTFNIDPTKIEAAITEKTKAIMPVHLGGRPADLDAIQAIAKQHNLRIIEDACQAWGSAWREQGVGAIGDVGGFSFQSSKNINAGEGGVFLTNDPDLYELAWSLHNVGRPSQGGSYEMTVLGGNMRMTEWQAAVLNVQLERLPEHMERREANASYLSEALSEIEGLSPLVEDVRITHNSYHLYRMRFDNGAFGGHTRDQFVEAMRAEGIVTCSPGYQNPLAATPAIHREMARLFGPDSVPDIADFPITQRASTEGLWLAHTTLLGDHSDIDTVVEAARKIQAAWTK